MREARPTFFSRIPVTLTRQNFARVLRIVTPVRIKSWVNSTSQMTKYLESTCWSPASPLHLWNKTQYFWPWTIVIIIRIHRSLKKRQVKRFSIFVWGLSATCSLIFSFSSLGIHIVTLLPHTSHKLQVLDVTVFGRSKSAYGRFVNTYVFSHPGKTFTLRGSRRSCKSV